MPGLFVTGTDTGVGKSVLAASLVAAARERGVAVAALKPVITGLDEPIASSPDGSGAPWPEGSGAPWPPDHELLAAAAGCRADDVLLSGYGPAISPHLAAELARRPIDRVALVEAIRMRERDAELLVVEGVGGLLVPLCRGFDVRRLAQELSLPLLIAARPGLGTINHTLLTLESARRAELEVTAVVLTPWPQRPDVIERSNAETIAELGQVSVWTLPEVAGPDPAALARAGAQLPLERLLARGGRQLAA